MIEMLKTLKNGLKTCLHVFFQCFLTFQETPFLDIFIYLQRHLFKTHKVNSQAFHKLFVQNIFLQCSQYSQYSFHSFSLIFIHFILHFTFFTFISFSISFFFSIFATRFSIRFRIFSIGVIFIISMICHYMMSLYVYSL